MQHDSVAMNMRATTELLLETVFSTRSVQNGYKEENWGDPVHLKSACEEKSSLAVGC
jgi:hypothetical protein